ncbi:MULTISPECIES: TetR/AcrR family transcriptional regulator [Oceanobacillus]|uniref:TetR/AcrR family transcriptional regulator n=1 Tax=Oceanobacillus aidingensis TaxID=645964 RepID=A0ABV9JXB9_9BACI|nr:TetR/AcrR family transcriptional regulator [Oceanobacillus oncorhynchi]MDM8099984.1 TetR/AcrR family transcriptional regulator [Oceanobacillus oncorhynchi]UUI40534.1 TetR/AcrR family transcriptional regulator [Oceanobacillus oncorhynchi]
MAPLNENQLEQIRHERKEQIMSAALQVFADNGIKLTKISTIAKAAKVSHGLIYHYFSSKEEVLYESLKWATAVNTSTNFLEKLKEDDLSPSEKIKKFVLYAFSSTDSTSSYVFRIIQNLDNKEETPQEVKNYVDSLGTMYINFLIPLIKEGQEYGEIIQEDSEELVGIFLTTLSGVIADDITFWQEDMERKVEILLRMITTR